MVLMVWLFLNIHTTQQDVMVPGGAAKALESHSMLTRGWPTLFWYGELGFDWSCLVANVFVAIVAVIATILICKKIEKPSSRR